MVVLYLFFVLLQVAVATFNYDQPVISGLIQSRHQFYYLSYFMFLLALSVPGRPEKFMKFLSMLAVMVVVLAYVNYAGVTVFHHKWAEGHGERSGIIRTFIPAMNIITMVFIWNLTNYVMNNSITNKSGIYALFFFVAILFRQTRAWLIFSTMVAFWLMLRERKIKILASFAATLGIVAVIASVVINENIFVSSFKTAYTDVTQEEGTWRGRAKIMQSAWETFLEHPVIGSGARFIRQTDSIRVTQELVRDAYQSDLGYAHWLKNYGMLGTLWLIALFAVVWKQTLQNRRLYEHDVVTRFAEYQLILMALAFITINYLVYPDGILVVCLALALLYCRKPEDDVSISRYGYDHNNDVAPRVLRKKGCTQN